MNGQTNLRGPSEPVAIVGMACRYAGGVRDPPGLWRLLAEKRDAWREFDDARGFSAKGFYHANHERPGSMTTRGGYLLGEDPRLFDPGFFGVSGREVETMDPSQRKLLEVVYEAFENGGETWESVSGSRTGVYVGNFAVDHLLMQSRDWEDAKPYSATGADSSILANRISYIFNLHGPSLVTTTACSSSMYALHLAVQAIRNGECDSAIVAAANCILDPTMQMVLDKLGALSPTSRCHTFDQAADGYARGEGYAAIYLKKSWLAAAGGSPIRAMIRGTAVNANGRTGGIARPQADGQEAVIRKAYENAGHLSFSDTAFFECHGTGTQAGDPIEVSAVGNVFASSRSDAPEDRLLIGAVKTNLGHTEGASAIASVIKVVLSLEAGEIAPSYGIETLNPAIDFAKAKVEVVRGDRCVPWPKGKLRRASINSFGFGGANGHCIIDHVNVLLPHYVKPGVSGNAYIGASNGTLNGTGGHLLVGGRKVMAPDATTRQLVLLPFSAHSTSSLQLNIQALSRVIQERSLADVAYTLASKRSRLQHRCFHVVSKDNASKDLLENDARTFASLGHDARVGFIFTGQGAQWYGMGAQLFEYAVFRDTISCLDRVVHCLNPPPSWTIRGILNMDCEEDRIHTPDVAQTVCTAVQIGIVDLLASWSVRPSAVVGHSSGEIAAAYAAGYMTAAEAIAAAYLRGQTVSKNKRKGTMLAVGLGAGKMREYLEGRRDMVEIAAINSPSSVTISGDAAAVDEISTILTKEGIFNRALRTGGNAYHSHHMQALSQSYFDALGSELDRMDRLGLIDKHQSYPRVCWVSSVHPDEPVPQQVSASYWMKNLESPVMFCEAISNVLGGVTSQVDVLVELGPHPSLKGPLDQICKSLGRDVSHVASLRRGEDSRKSMLQLAGSLFALNAPVDLVAVNAVDDHARHQGAEPGLSLVHGCTAVDLPPYQYTYQPVNYYESRPSKEFRLRKVPRHDLLGVRVPGTARYQPQWRNVLGVKNVPWLSEHRLLSDACFPVTGFVAMAIEAAAQTYQEATGSLTVTGYSIHDMDIKSGLVIPEDENGVEVVLSMTACGTVSARPAVWSSFTISSVNSNHDKWTEHCTGKVRVEISEPVASPSLDTHAVDLRAPDVRAWYRQFRKMGIGHGPAFQTLSELGTDPTKRIATATIALNTTAGVIPGGESSYALHPTALDGMLQLGLIACSGGQVEEAGTTFVPLHLTRLYIKSGIHQDQASACAVAHSTIHGAKRAEMNLQLLSKTGQVVVDVKQLTCTSLGSPSSSSSTQDSARIFSSPFSRVSWKPDFDSLDKTQLQRLFPPPEQNHSRIAPLVRVDKIVALVLVEIYHTFLLPDAKLQPPRELGHWVRWAKSTVENDQREAMIQARRLSPDERRRLLLELYDEAGDDPEAKAARILHENMGDILDGKKTSLEVLVPDGLLTRMYQEGHMLVGAYPQLSNVLDCLSHRNPNLRILEIGAGTGGATRVAMRALAGPNGIKRYADYTFTDVSPGFLTSARSFLQDFPDMEFSILDIEQDPVQQGYDAVYDLVLASQSIHATASMKQTLANCRRLLKPGGKLVLVESTRTRVLPGLLYGTMTGYWLGIDDGRSEGPFMSLKNWDGRLKEAGFSGSELSLEDYPEPFNTTSVIVSTLVGDKTQNGHTSGSGGPGEEVVHLLHGASGPPPLLDCVARHLADQGIQHRTSPVDEALDVIPENARVMMFLDGENLLLDVDQHRLDIFQHLARNSRTMVWLTSAGIVKGRNPAGALVVGLLRTLGSENPSSRFSSIDIDADGFEVQGDSKNKLVRAIVDLEISLQGQEATASGSQDREFTWQDGCLWLSRVVPDDGLNACAEMLKTPPKNRYLDTVPLSSQGPLTPVIECSGARKSLCFRRSEGAWQPLPGHHIEVQVSAASLSPADLDSMAGRLSRGLTGVVTKVGVAVAGLSPGDHVWGVSQGSLSNYTRVPAIYVQHVQPGHDAVSASAMVVPYMAALYALDHLARIKKGQRVLITPGTGHFGLAAAHYARMKGADVFATAATPDDARVLVDSSIFSSSRILSSKDLAAISQRSILGDGKGFSAILVTAAGVGDLQASLDALAPMGHLIHLCGHDTPSGNSVSPRLLQKHGSVSTLNVDSILETDPELGGQLMKTVSTLYQQGQIFPLLPTSALDISDLSQVLSESSRDVELGKAVVTFQDPNALIKTIRAPPAVSFDPAAVYIISGGLGGLGRAFVRWMAERGARELLVLSRRGATTPDAESLVRDLAATGVRVRTPMCDVSDRGRVLEVVQEASSGRPIKGVIHAALSLSDISFDKLTADRWREGIAAKVNGTRHLHEATTGQPLDFFIMTTSTESIWAPPTQSVYMAASNFQDHFARYRRRHGLPASTIAYGLVSDVRSDWRSGSSGTVAMYERNKALTISEHGVLAALNLAFLDNGKCIAQVSSMQGEGCEAFSHRHQHDPLSDANIFTCLDPSAMAAKQDEAAESSVSTTSVPRWYNDGKVSLIMRALHDAQRLSSDTSLAQDTLAGGSQSAVKLIRQEFDRATNAIKDGRDELNRVVAFVTGATSKALSDMLFIDVLSVNPSNSIAGHGVDSLIAAELRNWFHQAFGVNIRTDGLLDADISIQDLAAEIVGRTLSS